MSTSEKNIWQSYRIPVLLLSLLWVLFRSYYFFEYDQPDRHLQSSITYHLSEGNGLSVIHPDPTDLSHFFIQSFAGWPPGYNLVQLPINLLVDDYFLSMKLIHLLGIMLLYAALHLLLFYRISPLVYTGFFSGLAISFAPVQYVGSTGLWSAAGLFFAVHQLLLFTQTQHKNHILLAVTGLTFACLFRYAYYPYYLILPMAIFFFSGKRSEPLKFTLLTGGLSLFALIAFQQYQSWGQSWFDSRPFYPDDQWIYWTHLTKMDIFPVKAFCYVEPSRLALMLSLPKVLVITVFGIVAILMLVFIGNLMMKSQKFKEPFYGLLLMIVLLNLAPLIIMSLTVPSEVVGENGRWTYVQESRYFLPVMLIIQIWFWEMVVKWKEGVWYNKVPGYLIIAFLLYGGGHTALRFYEYFGRGEKRRATGSFTEVQLKQIHRKARQLTSGGKKLIYIYGGRDPYLATNMAVVCGGGRALPLDQWNKETYGTSEEIIIWLDVSKSEARRIPKLEEIHPNLLFKFPNGAIYEGSLVPE